MNNNTTDNRIEEEFHELKNNIDFYLNCFELRELKLVESILHQIAISYSPIYQRWLANKHKN